MARFTPLVLSGLILLASCNQESATVWSPPTNPNAVVYHPNLIPPSDAKLAAATQPAAPATQPAAVEAAVVEPADVPDGWIPEAPARPWKWIVIHHSATTFGSAAIIDRWHRDKGWDELGYHFVIGNGTDSGDGEIEVGPRWPKQKWGAHTKTPDNRFNDYGIGICLVGNFDEQQPTPAQMESVSRLVAYLMKTYKISPDCVLGHGEAKPTDCPGKNLSVAEIRRRAGEILFAESKGIPDGKQVASTDVRVGLEPSK